MLDDRKAADRQVAKRGPDELTTREEEGAGALMADGASTKRMSSELYLSEHTVRNHVRNILIKLGAHSKLEAVAIAQRRGLVPQPTPLGEGDGAHG